MNAQNCNFAPNFALNGVFSLKLCVFGTNIFRQEGNISTIFRGPKFAFRPQRLWSV